MLLKEIHDLILRMFFQKRTDSKKIFFCSFVANLFNTYPTLDLPTEKVHIEPDVVIEETREEKTYRNFINSFGFDPRVNYLYSDLCDGLIILQVKLSIYFSNEIFVFSCMTLSVLIQLIGQKFIKLLVQLRNVFKN